MSQGFDIAALPADHAQAVLAGRVMLADGPAPVIVRDGRVFDVSAAAPTTADLFDLADPAGVDGSYLCDVAELTVGGAHALLAEVVTAIGAYDFEWASQPYNVTASAGLVPIRPDSDSVADLLSHADAACRAAVQTFQALIETFASMGAAAPDLPVATTAPLLPIAATTSVATPQ